MIRIDTKKIYQNEKKKLKKNFQIYDLEKKFKYIQNNYPAILKVNIIEIFYLMKFFENKKLILFRSFIALNLHLFIKLKIALKNNFLKKHKVKKIDLVLFSVHKLQDQINFAQISNFLLKKNKKHLVIFGPKSSSFGLRKIYKNKNRIFYEDYLNINHIFFGILEFIKYLKDINKIIKFLKIKKLRFRIYKLYLDFFINNLLWKSLISEIKPKKILTSYFSTNNSILYETKNFNNKINLIGYAFTGLDGDSGRYLFHDLDLLLVLGKVDIFISRKIKKTNPSFMKFPKKIIDVGHTRTDFFRKKNVYFTKNKRFNFLYIKSNPEHSDGLDDLAIYQFAKVIKKFRQVNFLIQDRYNTSNTDIINQMIEDKLIKKKQVFKETFLEKLISKAYICIGTNSTALLRQAPSLDAPIIQLYPKKHHMFDFSGTVLTANNETEIENIIKKIIYNKNFYDNYCKKIKKLKKIVLSNSLKANEVIYKYLI